LSTATESDIHLSATPHKTRLTALHAICMQIFRHIAQKSLAIRQYACGISGQSAEKSDNAPYAQALCGVAFIFQRIVASWIRCEKASSFTILCCNLGKTDV